LIVNFFKIKTKIDFSRLKLKQPSLGLSIFRKFLGKIPACRQAGSTE
jgi:hypothetical protein